MMEKLTCLLTKLVTLMSMAMLWACSVESVNSVVPILNHSHLWSNSCLSPQEVLYCCEDYRDFVEFAMTTANRLETDVAKRSQKISVNVHGHYGSQEDRLLAKEKAVQRMHERELQRRRQEASGLHTSYQNAYMYQEEDSDNLGYTHAAETKKPSKKETAGTKGGGGDKGNGVGEKPLKGGGGSFDVESTGGHSIHRHAPALHPTAGGPLGGFGALNNEGLHSDSQPNMCVWLHVNIALTFTHLHTF
uniref:Uncharacterized protein n=1 Tax=Biomphalaria glabrata TaxID=6526 RepID=A0A2C9LZ52_BIOGL